MKLVQFRFMPIIHSFNDSVYDYLDGPVYRIVKNEFRSDITLSLRGLKLEDDI